MEKDALIRCSCLHPGFFILVILFFGGGFTVQDGQDMYLEVFHAELEAFIQRVKEHAAKHESCQVNSSEQQQQSVKCRLDPKDVPDTLPPVSPAPIRCLRP